MAIPFLVLLTPHGQRFCSKCLSSFHGDDLPEGGRTRFRRCPEDGIGWFVRWKDSTEIGEENKSLRDDSVFFDPAETGTEVGSSSSNRRKGDRLPSLIGVHSVDLAIEVLHMHATRTVRISPRSDLQLCGEGERWKSIN